MSDLQRRYKELLAKYDMAVQTALTTNDASKLPEIRALNKEVNDTLETMLKEVNTVPGSLRVQREELVSTLNRIQRDYNGLKENTDQLTLLRRIREGEEGATRKDFQFYLALFFVLCLAILAMIFFGGGQMKLETAMRPITPSNTAPLE